MPENTGVIAGYRLEGLLGRGGMGTVYRARQLASGRLVALKVLNAGDRAGADRLRREGRAQAALEHPHIVAIYESGESEAGPYLAMQLIDGPSLAELLQDRAVDARRALLLLGQVARALDAAHAQGLVHRDVKPHNVLVGAGDHAYLADFGLTRDGGQMALTATGGLVGTFAYMAPEVVRGGPAGPEADRYAFAAVAFECLTGTRVFPRSSDAAVLRGHQDDPPPRLGSRRTEFGDHLDDLFARALSKRPEERPRSAVAFLDALARRMEQSATAALPAPPPVGAAALGASAAATRSQDLAGPAVVTRRSPRPRRADLRVLLGVAVGAAAVVAAWLVLGGGSGAAPARAGAADPAGLRFVGAQLAGGPARTLDCRGEPQRPSSPDCTVVQSALPNATVVVPEDGVIRRWGVRAARGELTLAVVRRRDGGAFQVALTPTETVGSADVQWFDADVDVERGDLLALRLTPGAAVGVREGVRGAATERWIPSLGAGRPPDRGAGTGFDHELLLRVGILPGGHQRAPRQVTGSAARRLAPGYVLRRRRVALGGGKVTLALTQVGRRFVLDQVAGTRRVARIDIPDLRPGGQVVAFDAAPEGPGVVGVDVEFVNLGSARVVEHYFDATAEEFLRVR